MISLRIGAFLISLSIAVFMLTFKYVEMANGRIDRKTLSHAMRADTHVADPCEPCVRDVKANIPEVFARPMEFPNV